MKFQYVIYIFVLLAIHSANAMTLSSLNDRIINNQMAHRMKSAGIKHFVILTGELSFHSSQTAQTQ
jgi:hypothetical protein